MVVVEIAVVVWDVVWVAVVVGVWVTTVVGVVVWVAVWIAVVVGIVVVVWVGVGFMNKKKQRVTIRFYPELIERLDKAIRKWGYKKNTIIEQGTKKRLDELEDKDV